MSKKKIIVLILFILIFALLSLVGCESKRDDTTVTTTDINEAQQYLMDKYNKNFNSSKYNWQNRYANEKYVNFEYDNTDEVEDLDYPLSFTCHYINGYGEDDYQIMLYEYEINQGFKNNKPNGISKCILSTQLYTSTYFKDISDFKKGLADNKDNSDIYGCSFIVYYEDGNDPSLFSLEHCVGVINWLNIVVPIKYNDEISFEQFQPAEHTVHKNLVEYDEDTHEGRISYDKFDIIDT